MRPRKFGIDFITILLMGLTLIVLLFLFSDQADARTITVDDDGEAEFTNIQDAINASQDGDTVRVWDGTYHENVVVNRSLSLIGNGTETRIIAENSPSRVAIDIVANYSKIHGLNITCTMDYPLLGINGIFAIGQGVAPKISNEAIDVILTEYTPSELADAIDTI